jgi:enterochelin esterase-like enzyme
VTRDRSLPAPERFGAVVSQSGSFWWPGEADDELSGADVIATVTDEPAVPVRFWLEAGSLEHGLAPGNRKLHAALAAKGNAVTYREYQGGHDYACWRGGLGDGIAAVLGATTV